MFRKSNPVDYKIKTIERPEALYKELDKAVYDEEFGSGSKQEIAIRKHVLRQYYNKEMVVRSQQIVRIINSLLKQARAAYVYGRAAVIERAKTTTGKLDPEFRAENIETSWPVKKYDELAQATERSINALGGNARKHCLISDRMPDGIVDANRLISQMRKVLSDFQGSAYHKERSRKYMERLKSSPKAEKWLDEVKGALYRLRLNFPFVSAKNRSRLANALRQMVLTQWDQRHRISIHNTDLLAFGIPAVEIAGPWWLRTKDIKSPMEWIKLHKLTSSPTLKGWLDAIGLDQDDRQLVQSVEHYYEHHKAPPSVEWARRRSNELEEDRAKKDVSEKAPVIDEWLAESQYWRRGADFAEVLVPPMPDPTFHILSEGHGEELCRRAKRDGLCVVDVLTDIMEKATDYDDERESKRTFKRSCAEGVVTLIVSTDPNRRTVVGLNEAGICTSEHHCTGVQNKVDKVAYDYFKKPHGQF